MKFGVILAWDQSPHELILMTDDPSNFVSMRKIDLNNFQVATSETARDINSRIMLNLVRKHQPLSQADLMRYSGLQRSTVSVSRSN
jgi:hypothetical protein